jgi:hypothetical protein
MNKTSSPSLRPPRLCGGLALLNKVLEVINTIDNEQL